MYKYNIEIEEVVKHKINVSENEARERTNEKEMTKLN